MIILSNPDKKPIKRISFGKVEVGKSKTQYVFLLNETNAVLENIKIEIEKGEENHIEILEAPKVLDPGKMGKIVLRWTPNKKFKKALTVEISILGDEVYYT